jgi:hypothetical protein
MALPGPRNDQPPCFATGTLVHTKGGLKPIEEVRVGDLVLSYPDDHRTPDRFRSEDEYTYKKVTRVFVTDDQPLHRLIVSNLASGDRETLYVTGNHPFYCNGTGWTPVSKMRRAGDVLENFRFGNLIVYRNYPDAGSGKVYNFEVEDFHTYYVGKEGVWVHNACDITKITPTRPGFEKPSPFTWRVCVKIDSRFRHPRVKSNMSKWRPVQVFTRRRRPRRRCS